MDGTDEHAGKGKKRGRFEARRDCSLLTLTTQRNTRGELSRSRFWPDRGTRTVQVGFKRVGRNRLWYIRDGTRSAGGIQKKCGTYKKDAAEATPISRSCQPHFSRLSGCLTALQPDPPSPASDQHDHSTNQEGEPVSTLYSPHCVWLTILQACI